MQLGDLDSHLYTKLCIQVGQRLVHQEYLWLTHDCTTHSNTMVQPGCDNTEIFIYPGYRFKVLDALITNFHLPESTLVMLVSALAGREHILHAYEEAIREKYRFFSFGDAMFIADLKGEK